MRMSYTQKVTGYIRAIESNEDAWAMIEAAMNVLDAEGETLQISKSGAIQGPTAAIVYDETEGWKLVRHG